MNESETHKKRHVGTDVSYNCFKKKYFLFAIKFEFYNNRAKPSSIDDLSKRNAHFGRI